MSAKQSVQQTHPEREPEGPGQTETWSQGQGDRLGSRDHRHRLSLGRVRPRGSTDGLAVAVTASSTWRASTGPGLSSLSPGQVFRTSQGHLPVGRVDAEQTAPEVQDTKAPTNCQKKSPGFLGCKASPTPGVGTPLKVRLHEITSGGMDWSLPAKKCLPPFPELPRELMLFAQEVCRDPCMPAKKQLSDFLLTPTRSVLSDSGHV